ncbi:beta-galactosidase [Truncatella angustata]|uniref:Beta-galactosidase n=1 Tax=Truncatella angustata TaxID=152316 RepID=A0A9P8UW54_9PEZI|nr:beta-galactosidase [Truncatella angustata]KAH6659302.1 beta-galactosidase [Truncatella angustata]
MRGYFRCLLYAATVLIASIVNAQYIASRTKFNFNSDWKLYIGDADNAQNVAFDDSTWSNVTLPHAWNEDDAFKVSIENLTTGISWYRKAFEVPASNGKTFLEFEGIRHGGEFFVNGEWIGRSENGVMAFGFDVTNQVVLNGTNIVAARIDNSWDYREVSTNSKYQWSDKNFYANYGGINKNAFLHTTDRLYQTLPLYSNLNTTGVYIFATDIDVAGRTATVTAESEVKNEYTEAKSFKYRVVVKDLENNTVKSFESDSYTVGANETTTVSASSIISDLNFWSWGYGYLYTIATSIIVDDGVIDEVQTITGFRKTSFNDGKFVLNDRALHLKGYAQRSTNEWPALGSSVPAWLSDFSNQLVLASNGALIRWMHVTPWKQDIESLDRLGILQAMPAGDSEGDVTGARWNQRLALMRDAIIYNRNNPSVIFIESGNHGISEDHMQEMKDIRDRYDPSGGRAIGSRDMLNSSVAEYGGEMLYVNKGARIPLWQMEYSRDEGVRKHWDNFSTPYHPDNEFVEEGNGYDHNQDTHAVENVARWFDYYEQRPGQGKRVNAGGVNIIFSDSNTHHRGSQNYRTSGEVDAMRLPKENWYAHKVIWDNWVDIERAAIHIVGHWNYNDSTVKDVYVVSTADEVELQLNGKSLGRGEQSHRFLFTFSGVQWESGELEALGYSIDSDEALVTDKRVTSGEPAAIRLTPHTSPSGLRASGADVALIDVEVVDANGARCPTALNLIKFELLGEAVWRGGIAIGEDNYIMSTVLPVANGVNRVLLRSTTTAGEVSLSASSEGLESSSIKLSTVPFSSTFGLSREMPADGLTSDLSRGPTPSTASYTEERRALDIKSVTAGSGLDTAENAFDDDEATAWYSDKQTEVAWIRFQLEEEADISAVVLKLNGFRTSTYDVAVSVDNTTVWDNTTSTSLGYVTLEFDSTKGNSVTIASTNGQLKIVEAELYSSV